MSKLRVFAAVPAALLYMGAIETASADNCSGRYNNFNVSWEATEVAKGHSLGVSSDRSTSTSDDGRYVGVGVCAAYVLTMPDNRTRVSYTCLRKDKDGDSWSDSGTLEPGATRGTWTQVAGTGKFAATNGNSGWWQPVVSDGKVTSGIWGGNCK